MNLINQCQQSNISCICYSILVGYAIIITLIAGKALIRLMKSSTSNQELNPMILCIVQSLLHVIQYAVTESNTLQIITLYFQILIFTSISQLFAKLCFQVKSGTLILRNFKMFKILQYIFYGIILIFQIFALVLSSQDSCDKYYYLSIILIIVQQITSTIVTTYFGFNLLQKLKRVSQFIQCKTMNPKAVYDSFANMSLCNSRATIIEPRELIQTRKQITIVIVLMLITILLYISFILIAILIFKKVTCEHQIDINYQNYLIVIYGLIQMTPCLVIPYAFGFIPQVQAQGDYNDCLIILDQSQAKSKDSIQI
ncbi:unnamed protein product (macronuclear) [Paramecium tetraurelia]|uniref:G-protein coupled receptors family 1 profile domain-containing protein n=1 Tax=Paramecium tetraurelia TaxID=5888 RepID=A0CT92_PARTE|nr:uncharacterized protein GSPATT00010243001 [Paramecium tetraurelia]CAK74009.1 unnamed protein product [Paramecium tetraurelia]|eukprot:XP_001441406.1 hypothetical protein (macronuclear) [Paramecium tetraurelia strain d4-2]